MTYTDSTGTTSVSTANDNLRTHSGPCSLPRGGDKPIALLALAVAPGLKPSARAVGAVLVDAFNAKTGRCFPSVPFLMGATGLGRSGVFAGLAHLEEARLIRRNSHAGPRGSTLYEIAWERLRSIAAGAWQRGTEMREQIAALRESIGEDSDVHGTGPESPSPWTITFEGTSEETFESIPPSAATVATQPRRLTPIEIDEMDVQRVTDAIRDAGRPLTIGGVIEFIREHGHDIDGATVGRMVNARRLFRCDKDGRLVGDGRYIVPPEMAAAA